MFFAKIPRHIRQNAITEGDLECILTRNCEGTEQLRYIRENMAVALLLKCALPINILEIFIYVDVLHGHSALLCA